jgi:hypothetical protein
MLHLLNQSQHCAARVGQFWLIIHIKCFSLILTHNASFGCIAIQIFNIINISLVIREPGRASDESKCFAIDLTRYEITICLVVI